jgi:flagellar hook-basal body complex protein FliE
MLPIANVLAAQVQGLSGVSSLSGLSGLSGLVGSTGAPSMTPPGSQPGSPAPFSDLFTDAVSQVNNLQSQANKAVTGLIGGTGVDVHTAMIATQKASMAFELTLAVRNKAVQAYQQVVGMQF